MKKLINACTVMLFFQVCSASETKVKTAVFFETDKHTLTAQNTQSLIQLVKNETKASDYEVIVLGHADARGNTIYNDSLSFRRAKTVAHFLEKQGVPSALISISFFGERKSQGSHRNPSALENDRRVDVILKKYQFNSTEDLQEALQEKSISEYIIDPKEPILLKARNGSKVYIPKQVFEDDLGEPIIEEVQIRVVEGISVEECLANELSTSSEKGLLVSGGMMKVEAETVSGKPVKLKEGTSLIAAIPTSQQPIDRRMELFDRDSNGNWVQNNARPISVQNLKLPPYPLRKRPRFDAPEFKVDKESIPKAPKKPVRPRELDPLADYDPYASIKWYTINKQQKLNDNILNHHRQLTLYKKRRDRYDKREFRYNQQLLMYKRDLVRHQYRLQEWNDSINEVKRNWKKTPAYQLAIRKYDKQDSIYSVKYMNEVNRWNKIREHKLAQIAKNMDDIQVTSAEMLNTYVLEVKQLSWINVDRFYHASQNDILSYQINEPDTIEAKTMVIYEEIRANIMLPKSNDQYEAKVFKNEPASIFSYRVKEGKPEIYFQPLSKTKTELEAAYRPSSFAEIKLILQSFNKRT